MYAIYGVLAVKSELLELMNIARWKICDRNSERIAISLQRFVCVKLVVAWKIIHNQQGRGYAFELSQGWKMCIWH